MLVAPDKLEGDHFFAISSLLPLSEQLLFRSVCQQFRADVARIPGFWDSVFEARFCRKAETEFRSAFTGWRQYKDCIRGALARSRTRQLQQMMSSLRLRAEPRGDEEA